MIANTHSAARNNNGDNHSAALAAIRSVYAVWGKHPRLYAAQDAITFLGRASEIRRQAVEATGVARGGRLLEVGCGTGRNFPYIQELLGPEGRLVGFDSTEEMLSSAAELVRREGWSNVELIQGDATELDVGSESFDGVLCALAMSVMPDQIAVIRRCKEVLRPGGIFSVVDARPFTRGPRFLNPLVRAVYTPTTAWRPDADIPGAMREVFGDVRVETFNYGTFFIATSRKDDADDTR